MSTPLFIREPVAKLAQAALGVDHSNLTAVVFADVVRITDATTETIHVERVAWVAAIAGTDTGNLVLYLTSDAAVRGAPVRSYPIAAASASGVLASDEVEVNIDVPAGFYLQASHDVQKTASYRSLYLSALGGIVR